MKRTILLTFLSFFLWMMPIYALSIPESVDEYYLDDAQVMSEELERYLSEKNYDMDRHSGAYIEVVTQEYINCDILDYSVALFNEWQIGSNQNNGILFVIVTQEEKYYVTIGRGLESYLSSFTIEELLEQYFEPYFDQGDYETGIRQTFDALYEELVDIYGNPQVTSKNETSYTSDIADIILLIFFTIMILVMVSMILSLPPRGIPYSRGRYPRRHYHTHTYRQPSHRTTSYYHRPSGGISSSRSHSGGARSRGGATRGSGGGRR